MRLPSGAHSSLLEKAFALVITKDLQHVDYPAFVRTETEDLEALKQEIRPLAGKLTELSVGTYTYKTALIKDLRHILQRLRGELDLLYGPLSDSEAEQIKAKLCEEIACPQGLHDRAQEVLLSFDQPKNFAELLQIAREDVVSRLGGSLLGEVHAANTVTNIANKKHYGVRPRNTDDQ